MSDLTAKNEATSGLSPGQILKAQQRKKANRMTPRGVVGGVAGEGRAGGGAEHARQGAVEVSGRTFRADDFVTALKDRGVLLAPIVVEWRYEIQSDTRFSKWIKTKDILLSGARLGVHAATAGVHYFGTYLEQSAEAVWASEDAHDPLHFATTIWGFSDEDSMHHMFRLCRGEIDRVSIVETDLRDFVLGLKAQIAEAGNGRFTQRVLVAAATV